MTHLTPREIVAELDRHIIGQTQAKRAVAVAVRNRWRRQQLEPALAKEVVPKNIVMIGPTGVGKTEIARRLARLTGAPFVKVEASKYTEVGYHGRDVESMVRDLVELAVTMVREEHAVEVRTQAESAVEDRLVSLLLGDFSDEPEPEPEPVMASGATLEPARETSDDTSQRVRDRMRTKLAEGFFDDREIEITIQEKPTIPMMGGMGQDQIDPGVTSMLESLVPARVRRRRVTVARARAILLEEETEKLIDQEKVIEQAIERSQTGGIIFIDEIDKIATSSDVKGGADVSRQGVQRDLLPIVEGSAVTTRYGVVHTDQILFIAAGAFHTAAVSDLMPELQGRFPIRVELSALTRDDFRRILTEPDGALTVQQREMLATEGLTVTFEPEAIDAMADLAAKANATLENIGARRLMTVMECIFEDISFDAPDLAARGEKTITITPTFVHERLERVLKDEDLSRFVL